MNKELFYQKMQPYFDQGMAKEVYSSDYLSIIRFGERVYVACPYVLYNNQPYGIFVNSSVMKKIVENNASFFPILQVVFNNISSNRNLFFLFSQDKIGFWKDWIQKNSHVNKVDFQLESEINQIKKGKSK